HHLTPTVRARRHRLGLLVAPWTWSRAHRRSNRRQRLGIQPIRLGQASRRLGAITPRAWMAHRDREVGEAHLRHEWSRIASGRPDADHLAAPASSSLPPPRPSPPPRQPHGPAGGLDRGGAPRPPPRRWPRRSQRPGPPARSSALLPTSPDVSRRLPTSPDVSLTTRVGPAL